MKNEIFYEYESLEQSRNRRIFLLLRTKNQNIIKKIDFIMVRNQSLIFKLKYCV